MPGCTNGEGCVYNNDFNLSPLGTQIGQTVTAFVGLVALQTGTKTIVTEITDQSIGKTITLRNTVTVEPTASPVGIGTTNPVGIGNTNPFGIGKTNTVLKTKPTPRPIKPVVIKKSFSRLDNEAIKLAPWIKFYSVRRDFLLKQLGILTLDKVCYFITY